MNELQNSLYQEEKKKEKEEIQKYFHLRNKKRPRLFTPFLSRVRKCRETRLSTP